MLESIPLPISPVPGVQSRGWSLIGNILVDPVPRGWRSDISVDPEPGSLDVLQSPTRKDHPT